jgi:2-polyprenyl-3-methyl-5-hydroxy-6-metoxy-1,4-benzoquinol methylase
MLLNEWPMQFRPVLSELMVQRKYTALHMLEDISGASGAHTYLAAPQTHHGAANVLILKLGNKAILDRDCTGLEKAKEHFLNANLDLQKVIEFEGTSCLIMQLAGTGAGEGTKGTQSFSKYYAHSQDPEEIVQVIEKLFRGVLRRDKLDVKHQQVNVFDLYKFENAAMMSRELSRIGDTPPTFTYWWEKASKQCTRRTFLKLQHGDLHSKNVIINETKIPYVIDFAQTGCSHVMRDIAKFERDIRLFLYMHDSQDFLKDYRDLDEALSLKRSHEKRTGNLRLQKACCAIEALHKLASESLSDGSDWNFEYYCALLAQFIFAAGNPRVGIEVRKIALHKAWDLRDKLAKDFGFVVNMDEEIHTQKRRAALWRIAYAFFRLDQLPSGGWSKTLPKWMEALWEGDASEIERNRGMRTIGGTDLTCYAFYQYCTFLNNVSPGLELKFRKRNSVADAFRKNFRGKIGFLGGIGVGGTGRGTAEAIPIRIRHTVMSIIGFLLYSKEKAAPIPLEELERTMGYLANNLKEWKVDNSHYFGTYAALIKLLELLSEEDAKRQLHLRSTLEDNANKIRAIIYKVLPEISGELLSLFEFAPRPKGLFNGPLSPLPFFAPYHRFWRMKRSNFLMYFPFLLKSSGTDFIEQVDPQIQVRCQESLREIINDILTPFNPNNPIASLVRYHEASDPRYLQDASAQRDWGLSAEVAAILEFPVVQRLLQNGSELNPGHLNEKRTALHSALLNTFNGYYTYPEIFKFTHGVSFSRYLTIVAKSISAGELDSLDQSINDLINKGVTEKDLNELVDSILNCVQVKRDEIDIRSIVTMLVHKLESGEYTPDPIYCKPDNWNERVREVVETSTISFYDSKLGREYSDRYKNSPIIVFVNRIDDITGWKNFRERKALDVGCGPGQYAKLLKDKGFEVELLDASTKMLEEASNLLGINVPSPKNIYDLDRHFPIDKEFDLIFACAMMIHVPKDRTQRIYMSFYRLLKPGGLLFVNFKIGDHSLICDGGRFFEYYSNHNVPLSMIEAAGFKREDIILKWNKENRYGDPMNIYWANCYFRKPV